eukprot:m.340850 g.340850  ORF g.340850 m.340850 type:complete len:590 (+) comp19603_c0_seq1:177-1946(+)
MAEVQEDVELDEECLRQLARRLPPRTGYKLKESEKPKKSRDMHIAGLNVLKAHLEDDQRLSTFLKSHMKFNEHLTMTMPTVYDELRERLLQYCYPKKRNFSRKEQREKFLQLQKLMQTNTSSPNTNIQQQPDDNKASSSTSSPKPNVWPWKKTSEEFKSLADLNRNNKPKTPLKHIPSEDECCPLIGGTDSTATTLPQAAEEKEQLLQPFQAFEAPGWNWIGPPIPQALYPTEYVKRKKRTYYTQAETEFIQVALGTFVHLKAADDEADQPYVARVVAMYEDLPAKEKMISVEWLYRPEEMKGGRDPSHGLDELFWKGTKSTRSTYSIRCIEEPVIVVSYREYCRYHADRKMRAELGIPLIQKMKVYYVNKFYEHLSKYRAKRKTISHAINQAAKQPKTTHGKATDSAKSSVSSSPKQLKAGDVELEETKEKLDINKRNQKGETLLHAACIKGDIHKTRELIRLGSEVNTRCHSGWTPLHEVSLNGHVAIARALLSAQADVNATAGNGITALHDAVQNGYKDMIELLMKSRASPDIQDNTGRTPLDMASSAVIKDLLNGNFRPKRRAAEAAQWSIHYQQVPPPDVDHYS